MRRVAFTLFEVLIVLSLSAMIMLMVGSAIQLHLRMTDASGDAVKNAQLARVILRQISNDLRSATFAKSTQPSTAGPDEAGARGADAPDSESPPDSSSSGSPSDDASNATAGPDDDVQSQQIDAATQTAPGLYGDAEQIRIDIVRAVDTRDWFASLESQTSVIDSDTLTRAYGGLQTVAYFLSGTDNVSTSGASITATVESHFNQNLTQNPDQVGGLVRQVVDHPIASWALESGGGAELDRYCQLYAPEVVSIAFRYFDGTQWSEDWDSYELGGLPVAVEVTLMLATGDESEDMSPYYQVFQDADSVYTMVVHIPTALPTDETEAQL